MSLFDQTLIYIYIYIYIYPVYLFKRKLRDSVQLAQQARDFVQGDWTQPKG